MFEPTPKQFGVFWEFIENPTVTDIDYNGRELWITDLKKGKYKKNITLSDSFISTFTHNIANSVNGNLNKVNKILEADTKELRISVIHDSVATSGISICIRKSPCLIRNTIDEMIKEKYCPEMILQLLINCVRVNMNFVFGGEPGAGKTECAKFFMQFIRPEDRVITIEDSLEIHYREINPGADAVELKVGDGFTYTDAIKASLRQNPKWLMLSEARSTEVTSLLEQWSTGVHGFTTIHLDDLRKLPDRIQNMMNNVNDAARMENRIYRYVDVGILVKRHVDQNGQIHRKMDQVCFFDRTELKNKCYMIIEDGKLVSEELPKEIIAKFHEAGIDDPFVCEDFDVLRKEQRRKEETTQ